MEKLQTRPFRNVTLDQLIAHREFIRSFGEGAFYDKQGEIFDTLIKALSPGCTNDEAST